MQFKARLVMLARQTAKPRMYVGHGVVFIYGDAIYQYGKNNLLLNTGDNLNLDMKVSFYFKPVISSENTFLSGQAEPRR